MLKNNGSRSSRLFLIELIIAILFFSLGSAVCVQAFVRAHITGREAKDLAFASAAASSAASVVRYSGEFTDCFPEAVRAEDGAFLAWYGEDYSPCAREEAAYALRVERETVDRTENALIRVYDGGEKLLYELELRWPAAAEEGAA